MPTKNQLMTVAYTLGALAVIYRFGGKDIIEGNSKFLGIF